MTRYYQIPAQKYPNKAFLVPNLRIFCFAPNFVNKANSRSLISNMTMVFQKCCPKYANKVFLVELRIYIFAQNLFLVKFERDFKYDSTLVIFEITLNSINTQMRHFLSQIQGFLFLHEIMQLDKFEGAEFNYGNSILKKRLRHRCFHLNFAKFLRTHFLPKTFGLLLLALLLITASDFQWRLEPSHRTILG